MKSPAYTILACIAGLKRIWAQKNMCPVFLELIVLTCEGTIKKSHFSNMTLLNHTMLIGRGQEPAFNRGNHSLKRPRSVYIGLQFNFNCDKEVVANLFVAFPFSLHAEPKTIS